jgi:hypothetical protein
MRLVTMLAAPSQSLTGSVVLDKGPSMFQVILKSSSNIVPLLRHGHDICYDYFQIYVF